MQRTEQLMIETVGVPCIMDEHGNNLTPVGSRNRAILVVLALSPRMTVGRRWLEAQLWSDRDSEQASGSLRQALSAIRRQLGSLRDLLCSNRTDIWLQSELVTVDLVDNPKKALLRLRSGREFLEGIDITSEGFEDWLRQERALLSERVDNTPLDCFGPINISQNAQYQENENYIVETESALPNVPIIYLDPVSDVSSHEIELFLTDTISAQLTQTAMSHFRADVRALDGTLQPAIVSPGARFTIRVAHINGEYTVQARMTEEPTGKIFWSRQIFVDGGNNQAMMDTAASLATEASEAMAARQIVASSAQTANAMAAQALGDVFSFDPDRLLSAISILTEANRLDPHAPRPALLALALAFLTLESNSGNLDQLRVETTELINQSRAIDAGNALALSFLADVQDLVFLDTQTALSYAKKALHINPGIGYAYASLGALELRRGESEAALSAANRAQRQLVNSSLEVFSLMRLCVANMTTLNFTAAEQAAQKAAELAPTSQPPLRHLYALRLRRNDEMAARETLTALRRMDPTFSMQFLRENLNFPATTLRNLQLHKLQDVEL